MSDTLLNHSQVRAFTFDAIRRKRPGLANKMTRVSDCYFDKMEARLRQHVIGTVKESGGGDGKTLRGNGPAETIADEAAWVINQSNVRSYAQRVMDGTVLTQIAGDYAESVDAFLRRSIEAYIEAMPSVGKTVT